MLLDYAEDSAMQCSISMSVAPPPPTPPHIELCARLCVLLLELVAAGARAEIFLFHVIDGGRNSASRSWS